MLPEGSSRLHTLHSLTSKIIMNKCSSSTRRDGLSLARFQILFLTINRWWKRQKNAFSKKWLITPLDLSFYQKNSHYLNCKIYTKRSMKVRSIKEILRGKFYRADFHRSRSEEHTSE